MMKKMLDVVREVLLENELSNAEKKQLGQHKKLVRDKVSAYRYPTPSEWEKLRSLLVQRSQESNPSLDLELTAYTPGETLALFKNPKIKQWHEKMRRFKVPNEYEVVIFVPCAKTKPWENAPRGIYKAYNNIRSKVSGGDIVSAYFVTISEPLGIVPQDHWANFPQYDNPGLFKDDAQRSGLFTRDWQKYGFKKKLIVPFDSASYEEAILYLGEVIADFINNNKNKRFVSFVEDLHGKSTHSDMLDVAEVKTTKVNIERHPKRAQARQSPEQHILDKLK